MHPEKADLESLDDMLRLIDRHARSIVCVGEVGLDYSRHLVGNGGESSERAKEVQREVFARQARRAEVRTLAEVQCTLLWSIPVRLPYLERHSV